MTPRKRFPSRPCVAAALALAAAAFGAGAALAQCTYLSQPPWQTFTLDGAQAHGVIPGAAMKSSWTVTAVRPVAGEDWDLYLYPTTAASPTCVGGTVLATSTYGGSIVDFVIGDGAHNAHADVYERWSRYSGVSAPRAVWGDSARTIVAGGEFAYYYLAPDTLVHVYQVELTAGVAYEIGFDPTVNAGGTIGATAHLFRNPGTGTYWAGRPGAVATFSGPGNYVAPATGTYAIVIANDQRAEGFYLLSVASCSTPEPLASKISVSLDGRYPAYQFTPSATRWGAIGMYAPGYQGPWIHGAQSLGGTPPECFSDLRIWASPVDGWYSMSLGVVDFHHAAQQTYFVEIEQQSAPPQGYLEWDAGTSVLAVDGPLQSGYAGPGNPADVYDLDLVAGATYHVYFTSTSTYPHLLLFGADGIGADGFQVASQAVLHASGPGRFTFTAPATDTYGLVVVGDTYGYERYWVAVASEACPFTTLLADNVPTAAPSPESYVQLDVSPGWALIAARGATSTDDWDLSVSASPTGNPAPVCLGTTLASSGYGASALDFVAVRNRIWYFEDPAPAFARAHHSGAGSAPGTVLGASAAKLWENNPAVIATLAGDDPGDIYECYLSGGVTYTFEFAPYVSGITAHLFGSSEYSSGPEIEAFGRASALAGGTGNFTWTPPASGEYAIVVANDRFTGGTYRLRFGACNTPQPIAADSPQNCYSGLRVYSVAQVAARWSAFGVRYGAADWDLAAAPGASATWSSCLGGAGATSSLSTLNFTDFVVTDFHHVAPATWYAKPYQYAPAPLVEPRVEWSNAVAVVPNELYGSGHTMSAGDVLQCHEVRLTAGVTYTISISHRAGAVLHVLLFRNPGSGAYWAGRSAALLDVTPDSGPLTYVAPATDDYALVVVNDNGLADTYAVTVTYCPAPAALANGTPVTVEPEGFASFAPATYYWTAVGVRGPGDWDLGVYGSASGGPSGECFGSPLAFSTAVGGVDLVVGDFNSGANPLGTYYARPYRLDPAGPGTLEWAAGVGVLAPNGPTAKGTTHAEDVLAIWDVYLTANQAYNVYFTHTGAADLKALVFRNPGGAYWAPRSQRVWEGAAHGHYVATTSGWHALVVVNDNGMNGAYEVGLSLGGLDAGPPVPPTVTVLRGVSPNPARGEAVVEYALHEAAPVRLDVLDMAGRRVATLADGERAAGTYRVPWARAAGAVPPGLYFVRLQVAGRTVGERKVALVR